MTSTSDPELVSRGAQQGARSLSQAARRVCERFEGGVVSFPVCHAWMVNPYGLGRSSAPLGADPEWLRSLLYAAEVALKLQGSDTSIEGFS